MRIGFYRRSSPRINKLRSGVGHAASLIGTPSGVSHRVSLIRGVRVTRGEIDTYNSANGLTSSLIFLNFDLSGI